ncbi:hypothetical protein J6590_026776 [Homalodisca vitripennis]|nr:hypothetical protein J6590_026776 [Homalodisca vitripennis]
MTLLSNHVPAQEDGVNRSANSNAQGGSERGVQNMRTVFFVEEVGMDHLDVELTEGNTVVGPSSSGANLMKQWAVFKRSKLDEAVGRLQAEQT